MWTGYGANVDREHSRRESGDQKSPLTCTSSSRAGDRGRTGDLYLGKVALYQLSHARELSSLLDRKDPN
jgi:hypothetical protein